MKKAQKPKLETCKFILLTVLVPNEWAKWFYGIISEDAPFSWGDNNRTLVTANRLLEHCKKCELDDLAPHEEVDAFLEKIEKLGDTLVDLEN